MKKIYFLLLASLLVIAGCKGKHNDPVSPEMASFNSPDFALIDFSDVLNSVSEPTINSDMECDNSMMNYSFMSQGQNSLMLGPGMNGPAREGNMPGWIEKFDFRKHLGRILRQLELSEEQRTSIKGFMVTFHTGMKPLVKEFSLATKEILREANRLRKEIIRKLRSGELTEEQARTELKNLNEETKDKIKNNPEVIRIKGEMCGLRTSLLGSIESVLSGAQKIKWNDWLADQPNPCS